MNHARYGLWMGALLVLAAPVAGGAAEEVVATAVYAKIGNGYKREKAKDGNFKPEHYALANGGRIDGTTTDSTVDRVPYAHIAEIAKRVLAQKNYQYAKTTGQAKLLLVLNWGSTRAPNTVHKDTNVAAAEEAMKEFEGAQKGLQSKLDDLAREGIPPSYPGEDRVATTTNGMGRSIQFATNEDVALTHVAGSVENTFLKSQVADQVRDELNRKNAQILGYLDDLSDSNDIRRFAGGGDRYNDLINEVEEGRYYIIVSAYDFKELTKQDNKKLLWQVRVSVRSPGNSFNDSLIAMMKGAARYFGQNSGKLVRGEETKGTVELGDLQYLGEAKAPEKSPTKEKK